MKTPRTRSVRDKCALLLELNPWTPGDAGGRTESETLELLIRRHSAELKAVCTGAICRNKGSALRRNEGVERLGRGYGRSRSGGRAPTIRFGVLAPSGGSRFSGRDFLQKEQRF